jgi:AraC-like DNA-binding protein
VKPIVEKQSPHVTTELVGCEVFRGPDFACVWHQHPEVEITLVKRGGTYRMVGDKISPLRPGDLVVIGPDLPHDYRNEALPGRRRPRVEAVVVQFLPNILGDDWLKRPSVGRVRRLFQRARFGLEVSGRTRQRVSQQVQSMVRASGLRRAALLLGLLEELANSKELREIASPGFERRTGGAGADRIGRVCEHIEEHLGKPLYASELARLTNLSESAFSRLFKKSTGRTVPRYINELRVSRTCRLLVETERTVNQIARDCGYLSLANFQHQFHLLEARSPQEYRWPVRRPG